MQFNTYGVTKGEDHTAHPVRDPLHSNRVLPRSYGHFKEALEPMGKAIFSTAC